MRRLKNRVFSRTLNLLIAICRINGTVLSKTWRDEWGATLNMGKHYLQMMLLYTVPFWSIVLISALRLDWLSFSRSWMSWFTRNNYSIGRVQLLPNVLPRTAFLKAKLCIRTSISCFVPAATWMSIGMHGIEDWADAFCFERQLFSADFSEVDETVYHC